jgi:Pyruvate/2-oxoacid:ferredoxin oxidoreductase delta subunit
MDAVVGMEGNGPASPELREIGLILASDNAVALDGVVARMMGVDPGRLRFLQKAKAMGLGDYSSDMVQIEGEMRILPDFKLPPLGGEAITGNPAIRELMTASSRVRPQADPELCTACGSCIDHCSVSALAMQDNLPVVDAGICITCFCCQEICPEKAMSLK